MVRPQVPLSEARIRSLSNKVFFIGIVSGNKRDTEKTHIDYRIDNGNKLVLWNSYYVTVGDFTMANIKIWCHFRSSTYYIISEMDIELIEDE